MYLEMLFIWDFWSGQQKNVKHESAEEGSPKEKTAERSPPEKEETGNNAADNAFAPTLRHDARRGYPHMEWNGAEFVAMKPEDSPIVKVNVSLMHSSHAQFGVKGRGVINPLERKRSPIPDVRPA